MNVAAQTSECPGEELVLDYADGRLSADEQQILELHFDACASCTSVLAGLAHRTTLGHGSRTMARILPGTTVDRYLVRRQIGRGAMGVVFEAYDPELDRRVAIKVIRPPPGGIDEHERARVLHEARALARLSHPNVVPVLTVGARGDEIFVVMELVEGTTIREWLTASRSRAWPEIVAAFVAAGHGLAAAHRAGLVHRDFKPDNVLVGEDGRVRVIDFGLARLLVGEASLESSSSIETTGDAMIVGTPAYMPPEQLLGGDVDARADQFALAASIYEALAGHRPWEGTSLLRDESRASARRIPRRILRALDTALSTRPEQRFATTDDFVRALERASRRSGRRVAIAAAIGSLAIAAWVGATSRTETCHVAASPQWRDPARREQVLAAFEAGPAYSAGAAPTVQRELDRRVAAYDDVAADVCAATQRHELGTDATRECLELRRLELDTAVDLLAGGDADTLVRAVELVSRIRLATMCTSIAADHTAAVSADVAEERAAMLADLTRAQMIGDSGRFADGLAIAQDVWSRASGPDHASVRPKAAWVRASIHEEAGAFNDAIQWAETAYFAASEAGDDEVVLDAALMLVETLVRMTRLEDAKRWLAHGDAALSRHPTLEAQAALAIAHGRVSQRLGTLEETRRQFARAVELRMQAGETDGLSLARALDNLGVAYFHLGQLDEAVALHERVIAMRERLLGEGHPACALVHNNLALDLMDLGQYDLAWEHYEWARQILYDAYGPEHLMYAAELGNIGALWGRDGEPAAAAEYFAAALPGHEQLGPDHADVGTLLANLGYAELELGNLGEAIDLLQRALAIHEEVFGHDHVTTRGTSASVGLACATIGDHDCAVAMLEHALGVDALPGYDASSRVQLEDALAMSRAALHSGAASVVSPR